MKVKEYTEGKHEATASEGSHATLRTATKEIHRRDKNGMLYATLQELTSGSKKLHPLHNNRYR